MQARLALVLRSKPGHWIEEQSMIRKRIAQFLRTALLVTVCSLLASCEPPQVYGSVGYSSYSGGGYHGGGGMGTSVRVGGRIY